MTSQIDILLKNIEIIESDLKPSGFDITNYLLSDSEVVKNIISIRNTNMSKSDIDLMVDGLNIEDINSEFTSEINSLKNDIVTNENLKKINDTVSSYKSKIDIVNNIELRSEFISDIEKLKNQVDTPFKVKIVQESLNDFKNNLKNSNIPLPSNDKVFEEAKDLKRMISKTSFEFVRKVQELVQDVAFASITISQSIPGSIQLIITPLAPVPSFNISGMITMLMNVVLTLNTIKSKCADVKSLFINFSKIRIVCSDKNANIVASVLNNLNKTLDNTVCSFADKIESFIDLVLSAIKSNLDPSEEGKKIKTITKQLRKLKYLPNNNFDNVDEDDIDIVNNILEEWVVVDRTNKTKAVDRKKESKDNINNILSNIDKLGNLNNDLKNLTNLNQSDSNTKENIVYDVQFPDGTVVKGVTKEELDGYSSIYNIIYSSKRL